MSLVSLLRFSNENAACCPGGCRSGRLGKLDLQQVVVVVAGSAEAAATHATAGGGHATPPAPRPVDESERLLSLQLAIKVGVVEAQGFHWWGRVVGPRGGAWQM